MSSRNVKLVRAAEVADDVPAWVWTYNGKGRVQLGTLALFAGRPGAGKSTAARWFAAAFSTGTLSGCWEGHPQNVAYIAPAEESTKYIVKPGLRAAGADLSRIFIPEVWHEDAQVRLLSVDDEQQLTDLFIDNEIKVVIVDPLMDTVGAGVDINRNNEVRAVVEPWTRMAERLDGVVFGVAHLKKAPGGDVVAGINASSAFGEVARAVFGFAKDDQCAGDRIMSQAKNSTGDEDLALIYQIESCSVTTDSGKSAEVGRFVIIGESDRTVEDVLRNSGSATVSEVEVWLGDYLAQHRRVSSRDAKDKGIAAGFSESGIDRAARKLNVVVEAEGFPRVTYWSLKQARQAKEPDGTDGTDGTDSPSATSAASVASRFTQVANNDDVLGADCGARTQRIELVS